MSLKGKKIPKGDSNLLYIVVYESLKCYILYCMTHLKQLKILHNK